MKIENNGVLTSFLSNINTLYRENPYHNAMHASDVTNSVGFFLVNGMSDIFTHFEISCLIISALAHDLGHPGIIKKTQFSICQLIKYKKINYKLSSFFGNYVFFYQSKIHK